MKQLLFCLLLTAVAQVPAVGKKFQHPSGFTFELPPGWTVENGPAAAVLLPPGVKVDPNREDNQEVYTIWASEGDSDDDLVEATKENLTRSGVKLEGGGVHQPFKVAGKPGTSHTFDFQHPERKLPYRIRIFSLQVKGRRVALVAKGLRDKLAAREKVIEDIARSLDYAR